MFEKQLVWGEFLVWPVKQILYDFDTEVEVSIWLIILIQTCLLQLSYQTIAPNE